MKYLNTFYILLIFAVNVFFCSTSFGQEQTNNVSLDTINTTAKAIEKDSINALLNIAQVNKDLSKYDVSIKSLNSALTLAKQKKNITTYTHFKLWMNTCLLGASSRHKPTSW